MKVEYVELLKVIRQKIEENQAKQTKPNDYYNGKTDALIELVNDLNDLILN